MLFYEATILNLRFLRNAFRNRPNILIRYRPSIREVIVLLWNRMDILNQKHAVEHIALLPPETSSSLVRSSLQSQFPLLRRVALLEARYVGVLQPWLGRCLAAFLSKKDDVVFTLELSKGGMWSAMANAARADVAAVAIDGFLRITLVTLGLATVIWNLPLLGAGTSLLLVGVYAAFQIVGRGSEFDFLTRLGFNPGLSGLIACNAITATLIGLGSTAFGTSRQILWAHGDPSTWASMVFLCAAIAMPVNNMLVRMRDGLDDLGELAPVTGALRAFSLATLVPFLKEHWFIVTIMLLAVLGSVTKQAGWAFGSIVTIWVIVTIGTILEGAFNRLRTKFGTRLDRPKVLKFERHFSGVRVELADALGSARTDEARFRILAIADAKSPEHAVKLRDPTNVWPDGSRPTFGPKVDSYLAILDERWWGLG